MTTPTSSRSTPGNPFPALAAALLAGLVLAVPAGAQVCGDVTGDDEISVSDAQRVLKASVGQPVELVCTDSCAELEPRIAALEALLANVTVVGDNLVLTGMNFQVVSGSGDTDGTVNGTGNIILGYNEDGDNDDRDGSHNLILGMDHGYSSYGGIVAGNDNEITAPWASVLGGSTNLSSGNSAVVVGGRDNVASGKVGAVVGGIDNSSKGEGAVIVGGEQNDSDQTTTVVVGGESNRANGRSCVIVSGAQNLCTGRSSSVAGGSLNLCSSNGSVIGGGSSRTLGGASPNGWLAASLGPLY